MKKILVLFFLFAPNLALSFYCGNNLVTEGDSPYEVKTNCGEPDDIRQWTEAQVVGLKTVASRIPAKYVLTQTIQEHRYEDWTYDFGPHQFIRKLLFKNGELIEISDKGYGE